MNKNLLWSFFLCIISFNCFGQDLPEPQMQDSMGGPNPPPPGLVVSIDENSHLLIAAGLMLGVFLVKRKK